jgi:hypothetical protein
VFFLLIKPAHWLKADADIKNCTWSCSGTGQPKQAHGEENGESAQMAKRAARRKHQKQKQPKAFNTESTGIGRPFMFVILGGLLLAGIITRVYSLDRSLWLDEAWVANSIQSASLGQAIYYDDWLQTTPPLFIALSRLITALGTSNVAFRALPAFAGIVSIRTLLGAPRLREDGRSQVHRSLCGAIRL